MNPNKKVKIVCDIDGIMNTGAVQSGYSHYDYNYLPYTNREFTPRTGDIQRLLKRLRESGMEIDLTFISNSSKGRNSNEFYLNKYFPKEKAIFCSSTEERLEKIQEIIPLEPDKHTYYYYLDDSIDILPLPSPSKTYTDQGFFYIVTTESAFYNYHKHPYLKYSKVPKETSLLYSLLISIERDDYCLNKLFHWSFEQ